MAVLTRTKLNGAYVTVMQNLHGVGTVSGAADTVPIKEGDIVLIFNTNAAAELITFTATALTTEGRGVTAANVVQSVAQNEMFAWGPAKTDGWIDGSGDLTITSDNGNANYAIIHK